MKRISLLIFVLLAFLIFAGWAQSPPPVPEPAQGTVLPGGVLPWWPELNSWSIRNLQRTVVGGDMVHYSFDVLLGPGKFDMMTVHRVVREHSRRPYQPLRTADGVFLVPGAPQRFDTIFMPPTVSNVPARDRSFAVFLAKNDIDVWGLTFGWNFVPLETTDFSFMKGWGIEMDGRHTAIALSIARGIRESSGQGTGTLHLLGFSYGVYIAYAVAGAETQLPQPLRNVKGLIPVDSSFKYPPGSPLQQAACSALSNYQAALDAGTYQDDMSFLMLLGDLALYYPNDPAPDWLGMPGLTNYQAALALGIGAGFVGGQMDPLSLFYTEPRLWIDLLRATPPYGPIQSTIDLYAVNCGQVPVPFEAHFREIDLPIFYVGSEGWEGINGEYTAKQTRSRDITNLVIGSPDYPVFGHGDLFLAKNAEHLVWQPILKWLLAHR